MRQSRQQTAGQQRLVGRMAWRMGGLQATALLTSRRTCRFSRPTAARATAEEILAPVERAAMGMLGQQMRLVPGLMFPSAARMAERPAARAGIAMPGWQTHLASGRPTHLAARLMFPSMPRVAVSVQAAALALVAPRAPAE